MCEKRTKRVKKGSNINRLRQARRILRLRRLAIATPVLPPNVPIRPHCPAGPIYMDKALQKRVLIELAWKTVMLVRKNKIIQQKIVDLQKETTEYYVAKALNNPENRQRYLDNIRHQGILTQTESEFASLVVHPKD